jgi:hypothetical protein
MRKTWPPVEVKMCKETNVDLTYSFYKECHRCKSKLTAIVTWSNGETTKEPTLVSVRYCDECKIENQKESEKKYQAKKKLQPNPRIQRYCKSCAIEVGKGKKYCDSCRKKIKVSDNKQKRILRTGFTKSEENAFLNECMSNGIDTTGKIQNEYIRLGKKPRSQCWLIKRLKQLGIYKEYDASEYWDKIRKEETDKRINITQSKGFSIVSNDTRLTTKIKCDKCGTIGLYINTIRSGCGGCNMVETKIRISERQDKKKIELDKKKSVKIERFKSRVDKLKEFVNNEEEYKKYNVYRETPINKEYVWYNSKGGVKYREDDLTYKLQWIGFYIYITSPIPCPDVATKEGHSICRKCGKEKPSNEFKGFGCNDCAKEWRREFSLPKEREKNKVRYKTDIVYRLHNIISAYIYGFLKGNPRSQRAGSILGLSVEEFKVYLESHFEDWMNWDNQGKLLGNWQIQHIVPKQFAQSEEEAYLLNHYRNLIPMCAYENNSLHHRVLKEQLNDWHKKNKTIQKILKRNKDRIVDKSVLSHIKNHIEVQQPQHNFW